MNWTVKTVNPQDWHPVFAWWPFRFKVYREAQHPSINYMTPLYEYMYEDRVVWLEWYFRKYLPDRKEALYATQADMALARLEQRKVEA